MVEVFVTDEELMNASVSKDSVELMIAGRLAAAGVPIDSTLFGVEVSRGTLQTMWSLERRGIIYQWKE